MDAGDNIRAEFASFWMPFTPNRRFKADPRLIVRAEGMNYFTEAGAPVLDGTAGLWCVNAGHSRPRIVDAIQRQAAQLDYAPSFNLGHPLAFEFATRLAELTPEGLDKIFFCNSGSEAVDSALKIALAFHAAHGEAGRTRLIGRERGYHGVGFGGISVGGIVRNRIRFGSLLCGVDHLPHTHDLSRNAFSRGQPAHGAELADELEDIVALHHPSTVAAVIVEPIAGSTGVLVPPAGYLQRLREICDRYGILLIFDEVITAFGRTGAPFAAERFGVRPDMITMAKGLTSGTVPMGAVAVDSRIYDRITESADTPIELFHGYTYSAHPLACAAGIATLEVYADEDLFARAASLSDYWQEAMHSLRGARHVIDVRNFGLIAGIELESRQGKPTLRALEAYDACFERGLLIRVTNDTIALSPPLIVEKLQIDRMVATIRDVLKCID